MTASRTHLGSATPSAWQQFALNYAINRLYTGTAGPWLRQHTEWLFGNPETPAYVPPMTLGFLARDVASSATALFVNTQAMKLLTGGLSAFRHVAGEAAKAAPNLLTTAGGASGAAAGTGAGMFTAAALGRIAGTSLAMAVVGAGVDALFANHLGPAIERTVGHAAGERDATTVKTNKDGTVPNNTVKTSPEQFLRNFTHNACGSITYSTVLGTIGADAARIIGARFAGPVGALAGGVAAALLAGGAVTLEDRWIGTNVADTVQDAYRGARTLLGLKNSKRKVGDVIPVPGDRVMWAVGSVAVPFATAAATGQQASFVRSIMPR